MNSPFTKTALVSSGLLAIYGFAPIIFFIQPPMIKVLFALVTFFIGLLIIWAINIVTFNLCEKHHPVVRYILSYVFSMSFMLTVAFVVFQFWERPNSKLPFPYYPAFTINTLILILMNQAILKTKKDAIEYRLNQSKIKQLEAEKQVLAQQLQPHFLFNALSTLKSFIKINPEKAETYIVKLAEFLRFSLEANRDQLITLRKEMSFINDYLDLQQLRFGDGLQCTTEIDEEVLDKTLPVFAIQTLIENAIKHNAFTLRNPLYIKITNEGDQIKVLNNFIPSTENVNSTSTGLINLQKRYQMIGNRSIEIVRDESTFSVTVPLF